MSDSAHEAEALVAYYEVRREELLKLAPKAPWGRREYPALVIIPRRLWPMIRVGTSEHGDLYRDAGHR